MLARKLLEAAGNAGGESLYVEDVFSTYLYTGTGSNQTITNGIDFSGDGGLVWLKNRDSTGTNNVLINTERGGGKLLYSNSADSELDFTGVYGVTFNNNGFTLLDTYTGYNTSGQEAVSWSFRKAAKFFDVVTYTGNGTAGRTVSHSLGSVPGCIIVKSTGANNWQVYHNGLTSAAYSIWLNSTSAEVSAPTVWNSTAPTSTVFTVGSSGLVNNSGTTYVAYLFASDAGGFGDDGEDSIIKCGSYTGTGATGNNVTLGYEPQWLMLKAADRTQDWFMFDVMRGMTAVGGLEEYLQANSSGAAGSGAFGINSTSTGFCVNNVGTSFNASGEKYIYIAIRRPMKTPESGTEVYTAINRTGTAAAAAVTGVGFAPDIVIAQQRSGSAIAGNGWIDRVRGTTQMLSATYTASEADYGSPNSNSVTSFGMDGVNYGPDTQFARFNYQPFPHINYFFRRAPGFFDVVAYTSTTSAINHNLGVSPELVIYKSRTTGTWFAMVATDGFGELNSGGAWGGAGNGSGLGPNLANATATTITGAGNLYGNGVSMVTYLFATLAGVSKVGSYTGTAATLNVDCGFSAGARFILIKRTDSTGDWYVWDSVRGIVAGNDPYLLLNSTAAEVTNTDYIDPLASGFTVTSTAPAALNASGGNYIFLAIA